MATLLLSKNEKGIVIFHIWKSLPYNARMFLGGFLVFIGFVIQYYSYAALPGAFFILAGNLLLLVKGYDNRIKLASFDAATEWVKSDKEQLDKIIEINKKLKKWDTDALDISNTLGRTLFILSTIVVAIWFLYGFANYNPDIEIVAINVAILLFPHWFTGIKRITTIPKLINKIEIYDKLMKNFSDTLANDKVNFMLLVKGNEKKLPADVKMKIEFYNQADDFLGMYAQISLNNVQGKDYPYFYIVLVAKKSFNLIGNYYKVISTPNNVIKETKRQDDSEIIIIRQKTTRNSGYHTNTKTINTIFDTGIHVAKQIV